MKLNTVDFKLNFLGVNVADFNPSYDFYTKVLGIEARHSKPDWAYFETTGMKFELFSGGMPPSPDRSWGRGQAFRPSLHIADLRGTVADLRRRGVTFLGDIESTAWGEHIAFLAPEGIQWTLVHTDDRSSATSLRRPHVGWVDVKTSSVSEQRSFYSTVMGLRSTAPDDTQDVLSQKPGEPLLFLEPGGHARLSSQHREQAPLFIGFETGDIAGASTWLDSHQVPIVTGVTKHQDWGGIDLIIADADGNPIQVVEYTD